MNAFFNFFLYNNNGGKNMEFIVRKCQKCGAQVNVIRKCQCEDDCISCCGEKMQELRANEVDAAIEKHVPNYEIMDGNVVAVVNHVMEEDHYIEWISLVTDTSCEYIYLKPGDTSSVTFKGKTSGTLYSYCNKHGLWSSKIQ